MDFEAVVPRCFTFVVADLPLNVHCAISNFIRDALTADAITVSGVGTPLCTFLDQTGLTHCSSSCCRTAAPARPPTWAPMR